MRYIDIVVPDDNEQSFIPFAEKLDYKELCFAYSADNLDKGIKKLSSIQQKTSIKLSGCVFCDTKSAAKLKRKYLLCIFDAGNKDNSAVRTAFENSFFDLIVNLEINYKKEHTHYLNSGLDQVLCKLARSKIICFNFSLLLHATGFQRARLLARMMQNTRFCRKYKVGVMMCSFAKNPKDMRYHHDLASLMTVLKANPANIKRAFEIIAKSV